MWDCKLTPEKESEEFLFISSLQRQDVKINVFIMKKKSINIRQKEDKI